MADKRKAERSHYDVQVCFGAEPDQTNSKGQMVDISSSGMAFRCPADENCPQTGQHLVTRFSIPNFEREASSEKTDFMRNASVVRVNNIDDNLRLIAVQFEKAPPFWDKPPAPKKPPNTHF